MRKHFLSQVSSYTLVSRAIELHNSEEMAIIKLTFVSVSVSCLKVYYEQLVLHPEEWMRKILKFLDVPWNDAVLHHEEFINKPNGVPLSK